jgi:hypothetical protein
MKVVAIPVSHFISKSNCVFIKRLHGATFDFHPDSFVMPKDRDAFLRQVQMRTFCRLQFEYILYP